jgi:hypothetical protein
VVNPEESEVFRWLEQFGEVVESASSAPDDRRPYVRKYVDWFFSSIKFPFVDLAQRAGLPKPLIDDFLSSLHSLNSQGISPSTISEATNLLVKVRRMLRSWTQTEVLSALGAPSQPSFVPIADTSGAIPIFFTTHRTPSAADAEEVEWIAYVDGKDSLRTLGQALEDLATALGAIIVDGGVRK